MSHVAPAQGLVKTSGFLENITVFDTTLFVLLIFELIALLVYPFAPHYDPSFERGIASRSNLPLEERLSP